jgi:hypothetical protein
VPTLVDHLPSSILVLVLDCRQGGIAERVADAIRAGRLPHLEMLSLNFNHFGDEGFSALASAVSAVSGSLTEISLNSTAVSTEGALALARALPALGRLSSLSMWGNSRAGPEGGAAIVDALPTTIRRIWLSGNRVGVPGAQALATSLPRLHLLWEA